MQIARHIIVIVTVKGTVIASTVCFSPERVVPIASLRKSNPSTKKLQSSAQWCNLHVFQLGPLS